MVQERIKHNSIEIERNPIERFLMKVKQFLLDNRKWVLISAVGLAALLVISIAGSVLVSKHIERQKWHYEQIIMLYASGNRQDAEFVNLVVNELREIIKTSYFGMTRQMPYLMIGDLLYSIGEYKGAAENLIKYADMTSSKVLASVALQKAAIALEETGDLEGALKLYTRLLARYKTFITYDEFLYNAARVYAMSGDTANANKYFNQVINNYPQSTFAGRARNLQLLLNAGAYPKQNNEELIN